MNSFKTLDMLELNKVAIVKEINCNENLKHRLLDLGLIPGTEIVPIFYSPLGDPTAYEFRGNIIAIRNNEAKKIIIN